LTSNNSIPFAEEAMIIYSPYDLKLLKVVNLKETFYNIDRYIVNDYVYIKEKEKVKVKPFIRDTIKLNPVILYGLTSIETDIPPFSHPLVNQDSGWIALDLRQVVSITSDKEDYRIRNQNDYEVLFQRFILSGLWFIGEQSSLYKFKFPHEVFATWISENISRKFGLDLNDQIRIKVLGYIYYTTLFKEEFTDEDFQKLVIRLNGENIPNQLTTDVYDKVEKLNDINDFIKAIYTVTTNIRLKKLDYVGLVTVLLNTWFGQNSKEVIMLALEHPPTWISLIYGSLLSRSYSKSNIGSLTERLNKKKKGDEFLKELMGLTKPYTE
jgi:hypothetical protein